MPVNPGNEGQSSSARMFIPVGLGRFAHQPRRRLKALNSEYPNSRAISVRDARLWPAGIWPVATGSQVLRRVKGETLIHVGGTVFGWKYPSPSRCVWIGADHGILQHSLPTDRGDKTTGLVPHGKVGLHGVGEDRYSNLLLVRNGCSRNVAGN